MVEIQNIPEHLRRVSFTKEQNNLLIQKGFTIYSLKGESIRLLKNKGVPFWSKWHDGMPIENIESRLSEVAINVKNPFLPKSGGMTVFNQLLCVNEYSHEINANIPGVAAIIGSSADYLALINSFRGSNHNSRLFSRYGGCDYATTTSIYDLHSLFVGEFYDDSLVVSYRFGNSGYSDIKILPLIVPQI